MKRFCVHFIFCLLWIVLFSTAVFFLWNWLIPSIFGLASISFWQAIGLLVLCKILFSGFGMHKLHHRRMHAQRNMFREKWLRMSPEEREEFIRKRQRYGFGKHFYEHLDDETIRDEE